MAVDARDEIWEESFGTYYDVYYEEMLTEAIINWWLVVDEVVTILVGLTVVICLLLFSRGQPPNGDHKNICVSIILFPVFWAMFHIILNVPERLKNHGESARRLMTLRINLETFRNQMRINPDFPIDKFTNKFTELRQNFLNNMQLVKPDILKIAWLKHKIHAELNTKLQNEIQAFEGCCASEKEGKAEHPCPKPNSRPKS
jgi:hypothetical protein